MTPTEKPTLSVIIPVFNEQETILRLIEKVLAIKINKEIIIVEDFSTDKTREILKKINNKTIKIIFHSKNHGKGYAIRTGLKYATGKIIIIQDADLEYDPQDYEKIITPIIEKQTLAVYGTRFPKGKKVAGIAPAFYFGNKLLTFLSNTLYKTNITDEATCYKAIDSQLINSLNLTCTRFEFCPELTAKISKKGHKIIEVPISYNPRTKKQGKKIRWRDGIQAIVTLLKYKFVD